MSVEQSATIYVYYHKDMPVFIDSAGYVPVKVGNALHPTKMDFLVDDSFDSISDKNLYYSELTGIYWVWKNTKQEITGSCHYRRYFTTYPEIFKYRLKRLLYFFAGIYRKRYGLIYTRNIEYFSSKVLNQDQIKEIFQSYDVILPVKRKLKYSVKEHYRRYHDVNDLSIIEAILQEKYPEYLSSFHLVLNNKRLYANNMFVLPLSIYNEFMEWWFDVLFEFEKRIDLSHYSGYQQRIFGFMGERLLTVWFFNKNLKIKELPLIYFKYLKFE